VPYLNNTPIVAMMIPIIRDLSRTANLRAKRLYIPLSFASILGGACTLIGTATNLMVYGPGGYKFTDFFKIGIPLTIVVGIVSVLLTPLFFKFYMISNQ
jgi:di/tricarboxylate transporter